jgi:HEAT repeat protein
MAVPLLAAQAFGQFEPPPVPDMTIEEAIAAIQSDRESQRIKGARLLEAKGPEAKEAVPIIIGLLRDEGPLIRMNLLHVLVAIGEPASEAVPELMDGLSNDNFHVRYLCCRALGNVGAAAKPAVRPLIEKLRDTNPSVRRNAALALGKLGPKVAPDAVKPLVEAMKDRFIPVREEAVLAVGQFGELAQFAIPDLKKMMDDREGKVRPQAARSMWKLTGDADLVKPALVDIFRHNNVAGEATLVLAEMGAVDELVGLLNSDPSDMLFPLDALGRLGPKAKSALPALRELTDHPKQYVREEVQHTISLIEGKDR